MALRCNPPHWPPPLRRPRAYQRLYESISSIDSLDPGWPGVWQERRLSVGLSAEDIYRRLPTAPDFEYGGYLTKTRIRYLACGATSAETISSRPCTFHTHPTGHPRADIPSPRDVYSFLKWRNRRAITVGNVWIWVWDKDQAVIHTVRRLFDWETENMVSTMRRLSRKFRNDCVKHYCRETLWALGMSWAGCRKWKPDHWSRLLREKLGIATTLIRREMG